MIQLPKWASRAAALSLVVFVIGAVVVLFVLPLIEAYRETDESIEQASDQLARYQHISETFPQLQAQLDKLTRRQFKYGVYLAGATDALAAAGLQEAVSAKIEKNGGRLRSIQILPVKTEGNFKRVAVRVQLTATLGSLVRLFYDLEAGKPFAFIDNLDIKNRRARRNAAKQNQDPELVVRFDLYGYLRPTVS